jgi:HAD superfamily phosphatase (TIGR01668 family)
MPVVRPQRYVASIDRIDLDDLFRQGIRCILFDRDNTVVPRDTKIAPPAVRAWFEKARSLGMRICMVSNNFHSAVVEQSASELECDVVHHAMKPAPFAVWAALAKVGVPAEQAVLIGDQMLTDMAAGNLAGVRTILVRPQSRRDLWYTYAFRGVEHFLLKGHVFEGEER